MNSRLSLTLSMVVIACIAVVNASSAANAQVQSVASSKTILKPNGPSVLSNVKPLTPEEHELLMERLEQLHEKMVRDKGTVPPGPAATVPSIEKETKVDTNFSESPQAAPNPGDFYIGRNKQYGIVGDGRSQTAEPAIANSGSKWLVTQNWSRAYSNNAGATFTGIADDSGPSDAPFFCCDQDAYEDHGRNQIFWIELFVNSGLTTGVVRLHVRDLSNNFDDCSYDFNGGAGVLYDYPHLGVGNNYIYLTSNTITNGGWTGATIWRFDIDQISGCQSAGGNVFNWTGGVGQVVWVPARGVTDQMYLVTIENGSQNRYFWWPENSNSIFWTVLNVGSSNFGAGNCTGGTNNGNWLADTLSTSSLGFQIRSALAEDHGIQYLATYYTVAANGGGRPQAYAAGTIVQTSNMSLLTTADIFNSSACFGFPDVTTNARGDLGLSIAYGSSTPGSGGDTGPVNGYVAISDDYSRGGNQSGYFQTVFGCATGNNQNPQRYGDFLTARVQEPVDLAFTATSFGDLNGVSNVHVCEFLRGRYYLAYNARAKK